MTAGSKLGKLTKNNILVMNFHLWAVFIGYIVWLQFTNPTIRLKK